MGKKPSKREIMERREAERIAIEARNTRVMEALINGKSKNQIAIEFGIARPTVHDIITQARELWKEYRIDDFDIQLTIELQRIDRIEAEAWAAYENSKKQLVTTTRRTDGTRIRDEETGKDKLTLLYEEVKTQTRHPDPRYLDRVAWCVEQRLKIMGGYAPEKHAATTPDGKQSAPFQQVTFIEVVRPVKQEEYVTVQALPEGS